MHRILCKAIVALISVCIAGTNVQQPDRKQHNAAEKPTIAKDLRETHHQAALEKKFKEMLTGVVFRGTWQMTNAEGLKGKAAMTPARPDRYAIKSVSKGLEDHWVITARVQYANKDAILPIDVRVVWAGDTPVITLDKSNLPMLGTYSARVMIYQGFYAGTWFGDGYGGVLSGHIIKAADEEMIKKQEKEIAEDQTKQSKPSKQ